MTKPRNQQEWEEKRKNLPINLISVNVPLKHTTIPLEYVFLSLIRSLFSSLQDRETFVEQTPRAAFSDNASQWSIFDAYNEDFDHQVKFLFEESDEFENEIL